MFTRAGLGTPNLTREDFLTDRLVVVYYPLGAGGKFLINCLGLSDQCVFQHIDLVQQQLAGEFSTADKHEFLQDQLKNVDGLWNDIDLGCRELFGLDQTVRNSEWWKPELSHYQPYNPELKKLIDSGKTFFATAHHSRGLEWLLKLWPNARVIDCREGPNFLQQLRRHHPAKPEFASIESRNRIWNSIKKDSWPEHPPQWQHSLQQPPFVDLDITQEQKQHILNHTPNKLYFDQWNQLNDAHELEVLGSVQTLLHWNTDYYLDQSTFAEQLNELYTALGLTDFDVDRCTNLLQLYVGALEAVENYIQN